MLLFTISIEVKALYAVDSRFFMGTYANEGTSYCSVIFLTLDHYSSVLLLLVSHATPSAVGQALIAKFIYFR